MSERWKTHHGAKYPGSPDDYVKIRTREGGEVSGFARGFLWVWGSSKHPADIVGFHIVTPARAGSVNVHIPGAGFCVSVAFRIADYSITSVMLGAVEILEVLKPSVVDYLAQRVRDHD